MFTWDEITHLVIESSLASGDPVTEEDFNKYISDEYIEQAIQKGAEHAEKFTLVESFKKYYAYWFIVGYLLEHIRIAKKIEELGLDINILLDRE